MPKIDQSTGSPLIAATKLWNDRDRERWSVCLFAGTALLFSARAALPISIARIAADFDWNKSTSGAVLSSFFWGYASTQLVAGWLADRLGGHRLLPSAALVWSLLTLATPLFLDLAHLTSYPIPIIISLRILTGIAQGFHIPSMASMVSRHLTATEKGRIFGFVLAGSHVGVVLAGGVGSLLLDASGWRTLFHVAGLVSLAWSMSFRVLTENPVDLKQPLPLLSMKENEGEKKMMIFSETADIPWKALFSHPAFWAAAAAQYAGGNAYYTIFNWLPSFFHDTFPDAKGVLYNVLPGLCIVCTSVASPCLATRLLSSGHSLTRTRKIIEGVSLIGLAMCLLLVPGCSSFWPALALLSLALAFRGFHHGGVSVNPHDFAPNHTGAVFGIFNAFGSVTGFVGVYIAGHVLEATGNNWSLVFWLTAAQCLIGCAVFSFAGTASRII